MARASQDELERVVHELSVHQAELEAQNRQLLDMQHALELSRDEYAALYDAAPVGYVTLDAVGSIVRINLTAATLLGVERHKLIGRRFGSYVQESDADAFQAHVAGTLRAREPRTVEVGLRVADERPIFVRLESVPTNGHPTGDRRACLTAILDVTEARRQREERERLERTLEEAQRLESLGVLAGGIAHDFNNLLTGILGNTTLAMKRIPPDSDARKFLGIVELCAERAADLCRQMLVYAGRGTPRKRALSLARIVDEARPLLEASMPKGVRLVLEHEAEVPPIAADPTQLHQVLLNLVVNGAESIGDQGGVVSVRTRRAHATRALLAGARFGSELPEGDYVVLEVTDDGSGMSQETLARVFDPFFTTKFTGRGLGLAVVHGIVRTHGAAIFVESEPDRGTVFRIYFPPAPAGTATPSELPPRTSRLVGSGAALVVDDEDTVRDVASELLRTLGFAVVSAADGSAALAALETRSEDFRVVLLDATMPRTSCGALVGALRRLQPKVPIVVMSGYDVATAVADLEAASQVGFIQKPLALDALSIVIEDALARHTPVAVGE